MVSSSTKRKRLLKKQQHKDDKIEVQELYDRLIKYQKDNLESIFRDLNT